MKEEEVGMQEGNDAYDAALADLKANTEPDGLPEGQQPDGAEPSKQGATEPSEPVFEIDGEKVPLSTLKEWKSGHMMQSDYTRKTQELKREKEQIELLRQALEDGLYGDVPAAPTKPAPADKYRNVPVEEPEFATPTEERLYRELQDVKGAVNSIFERQRIDNARAVNAKIDHAINTFAKAHPDLKPEQVNEVLRHANAIGVREARPDIFESVYRSMLDPADIEKRAYAKFVEEQKKKGHAALESPAGVSSETEQVDISGMDDEARFAAMVRDLGLGSS